MTTFFELLQFHLDRADPLEELSLLGLALLFLLALLALGKQRAGIIQQLPLPLAGLDGVHGVIGCDRFDHHPSTDCLHGDSGLELRALCAALAHEWMPPLRGATPPQRLTISPAQTNQCTSDALRLANYYNIATEGSYHLIGMSMPQNNPRLLLRFRFRYLGMLKLMANMCVGWLARFVANRLC